MTKTSNELVELARRAKIELDAGERWNSGIDHHPLSNEAASFIKEIDGDGVIRFGGDGDEGETFLYFLDAYFEAKSLVDRAPPTTELYFEAHVTIEPVFDERLTLFKAVCARHGFRAADLLMQKRQEDVPERSKHDTFATGRSSTYLTLYDSTIALMLELTSQNFKIWRYKIENTLLDVRLK